MIRPFLEWNIKLNFILKDLANHLLLIKQFDAVLFSLQNLKFLIKHFLLNLKY